LRAGQTASLLEQERPNIFTQSVGNIEPGQEVKIEIGYVDVLRYDMGTYEFHFPMVVGPRYIPGTPNKERLRIIVMLTDGYIGNEAEIIEHVGKRCGDQIRFWCVGIGSSPNMMLVDGVARQGGGMGKKLNLPDDRVRKLAKR
jgi:hypothetical protein